MSNDEHVFVVPYADKPDATFPHVRCRCGKTACPKAEAKRVERTVATASLSEVSDKPIVL